MSCQWDISRALRGLVYLRELGVSLGERRHSGLKRTALRVFECADCCLQISGVEVVVCSVVEVPADPDGFAVGVRHGIYGLENGDVVGDGEAVGRVSVAK